MTVSYKKLWKLLIDKNLKKKDTLLKICSALNCEIGDIMEIEYDTPQNMG